MVKITDISYWETQDNLDKLEEWYANGLSLQDIADNMGIARSTLYLWRTKSTAISNALHVGNSTRLEKVENAMFKRAIGYNYEELHYKFDEEGNKIPFKSRIVHVPAEPSMIKYYANNIAPDKYQDKVSYEDTSAHDKLDELLNKMGKR